MKTYTVTFQILQEYEVEAEDKQEARNIAWGLFNEILQYNRGEFDVEVEEI